MMEKITGCRCSSCFRPGLARKAPPATVRPASPHARRAGWAFGKSLL